MSLCMCVYLWVGGWLAGQVDGQAGRQADKMTLVPETLWHNKMGHIFCLF